MGGGLMQLVAYGAQDIYLTGNPQITFFKVVYRRHTNFSMECIKQSFKGTSAINSRVVATLARNGDLVHDCFIKVPSHSPPSGGKNQGYNIFNNIELEIGGQLIDKHYGHWMEAHAELTEENGAPIAADDRASGDPNQTVQTTTNNWSTPFQACSMAGGVDTGVSGDLPDIFVPLRFWFCRHVGLSLPLIALQYHEVNINVTWSAAAETATAKNPSLWCNYIYLDTDERRRFAQVSHEYLIEQVQMQTFTSKSGGDTLKLNFNHPVKELIWAKTGASGAAWGGLTGGYFLKMASDGTGSDTWQLKLNGHDRFEKQSLTYFTRYQPLKYHTSRSRGQVGTTSQDSIAVYSFALKPEEHQPSGTCNFSRIDNAQLIYSNIYNAGDDPLYVYAVNYNVLRIMSGMGGLAYSN